MGFGIRMANCSFFILTPMSDTLYLLTTNVKPCYICVKNQPRVNNPRICMFNQTTRDAASVAHEIMTFLEGVKDQGTEIDTGSGMDESDLWVKIGGIEWFITIKKSNAQKAKERNQL